MKIEELLIKNDIYCRILPEEKFQNQNLQELYNDLTEKENHLFVLKALEQLEYKM